MMMAPVRRSPVKSSLRYAARSRLRPLTASAFASSHAPKDAASFGAWDDAKADTVVGAKRDRSAYRKYLFTGDRLTGAIIIGRSGDVWTTNDVGMLKGLVQTGVRLGRFKDYLKAHPFDVKTAYIASGTAGTLLPETVLGRPAKAPGETPVAV